MKKSFLFLSIIFVSLSLPPTEIRKGKKHTQEDRAVTFKLQKQDLILQKKCVPNKCFIYWK